LTAGFLNLCRAACQTDHRVGWRASLVRDVREAASTRAWSGGNAQKVSRDQPTKALRERSPGQWRDAALVAPGNVQFSQAHRADGGVLLSQSCEGLFVLREAGHARFTTNFLPALQLPVDRAGIQHAVASLVGFDHGLIPPVARKELAHAWYCVYRQGVRTASGPLLVNALAGKGRAYACLDYQGQFCPSLTPCR